MSVTCEKISRPPGRDGQPYVENTAGNFTGEKKTKQSPARPCSLHALHTNLDAGLYRTRPQRPRLDRYKRLYICDRCAVRTFVGRRVFLSERGTVAPHVAASSSSREPSETRAFVVVMSRIFPRCRFVSPDFIKLRTWRVVLFLRYRITSRSLF